MHRWDDLEPPGKGKKVVLRLVFAAYSVISAWTSCDFQTLSSTGSKSLHPQGRIVIVYSPGPPRTY